MRLLVFLSMVTVFIGANVNCQTTSNDPLAAINLDDIFQMTQTTQPSKIDGTSQTNANDDGDSRTNTNEGTTSPSSSNGGGSGGCSSCAAIAEDIEPKLSDVNLLN